MSSPTYTREDVHRIYAETIKNVTIPTGQALFRLGEDLVNQLIDSFGTFDALDILLGLTAEQQRRWHSGDDPIDWDTRQELNFRGPLKDDKQA